MSSFRVVSAFTSFVRQYPDLKVADAFKKKRFTLIVCPFAPKSSYDVHKNLFLRWTTVTTVLVFPHKLPDSWFF